MLKHSLIALVALIAVSSAGAQSDSKAPAAAYGRYSGSLRGTSMTGVSDNVRFSGTVEIAPAANGHVGVYKVLVRLSTNGAGNMGNAVSILQWSLSQGRCGSRTQFMVPPSELPQLELRSGGDAEATWEGPLNLAANASYQMMVFDRGVREQDIVACANLKYSAPKN